MSGHAEKFMRDPGGFVGAALFPRFASGVQSSTYYVYDAENWKGIPGGGRRAPGTSFKRIMPKVSSDSFACTGFGWEQPVPDEDRKKYANYLAPDVSAVKRLTDIIHINHEIRVRDKIKAGTVPSASPSVKWDDASSDPKQDVNAIREIIRLAIGVRPNLMTLSRPIMNVLEVHPKIVELFKYTVPGVMSEQKLAQYFGIDRILVAEEIIATNQEGQSVTSADIWSDDVVLAKVSPGSDLMSLNLGRTFGWDEMGGGEIDGVPIAIETYRDETVKSDIHRALHYTDEKIVASGAGYVLTDVLAGA